MKHESLGSFDRVERDVTTPITVVVATILVLLGPLYLPYALLYQALFWIVFATIIVLHEIAHYFVLRLLGRYARIRLYLRLCSLLVEYEEIEWWEYIAVVTAPQVIIELPLLMLWIYSRDSVLYLLVWFHLLASLPDVINALRAAILFRGCTLRLYKRQGRIIGYIVKKPNGEKILFRL